MQIVDVAQLEMPRVISTIAVDGFIADVFVQKEHLFAVTSAGVEVFDISNLIKPSRVAVISTPGQATSLYTTGDYVFVNDVFPEDVNFLRVFRLESRSSTN